MTQRSPFKGQRFFKTKYLPAEYLGGSLPATAATCSEQLLCMQTRHLQLLCTNPRLLSLENILFYHSTHFSWHRNVQIVVSPTSWFSLHAKSSVMALLLVDREEMPSYLCF